MPSAVFMFSFSHEIAGVWIMYTISDFYKTITERSRPEFVQCVFRSLIITSVLSCLKSCVSYFTDQCALSWRIKIVRFLQEAYMDSSASCLESNVTYEDNVDQRICQDSVDLTNKMSKLYSKLVMVPFQIGFYTFFLFQSFGWFVPSACYLYFALASLTTLTTVRAVAEFVFQQDRVEVLFKTMMTIMI